MWDSSTSGTLSDPHAASWTIAPASSMRSIALSGRKRSLMYRTENLAAADSKAQSVPVKNSTAASRAPGLDPLWAPSGPPLDPFLTTSRPPLGPLWTPSCN
eukprot:2628055-Pyramimonas_sp.AAC.1